MLCSQKWHLFRDKTSSLQNRIFHWFRFKSNFLPYYNGLFFLQLVYLPINALSYSKVKKYPQNSSVIQVTGLKSERISTSDSIFQQEAAAGEWVVSSSWCFLHFSFILNILPGLIREIKMYMCGNLALSPGLLLRNKTAWMQSTS